MPYTPDATKNAHRPTVLVTGATGNVGREVVARLVERDVRVRCLVRDRPEPRADVEWVVGDLTEPAQLRAALNGVDAVFLIWPLLDASPAVPVAIELAAAGPRVVYLSSVAIDDDAARQTDPIVQVHADMEALLHRAGASPIVLRSDTLASNARGWKAQVRAGDHVSGPEIAETAVVDERDVADAVAVALLAPRARLDDGPSLLTGPEVLSRADQVGRLGAALDRPLRFVPLSVETVRSRMRADGRPEALVAALITAAQQRPASHLVTDHVERLIGRPPRTFAQWASDHAAEFRR